jgi:hypothetical protein
VQKIFGRVNFYYVFHLKSRFFGRGVCFKYSEVYFLSDFNQICTRKAKMYVVFYRFFQIMFWSMVFKYLELVNYKVKLHLILFLLVQFLPKSNKNGLWNIIWKICGFIWNILVTKYLLHLYIFCFKNIWC